MHLTPEKLELTGMAKIPLPLPNDKALDAYRVTEKHEAFYQEVLRRVSALAGVEQTEEMRGWDRGIVALDQARFAGINLLLSAHQTGRADYLRNPRRSNVPQLSESFRRYRQLLPSGGPDPRGRTDEGSTGMSTHRAYELAGLLGGTRSMNVRRNEPEKCTWVTPVYSTRNLGYAARGRPRRTRPRAASATPEGRPGPPHFHQSKNFPRRVREFLSKYRLRMQREATHSL
jgi:hypothetical protein